MCTLAKIDHLVITTADLAACTAFYRALGFEARDTGDRWEFFSGDFKINVHILGQELEPKARNVQPGSADLCFELRGNIEACRRELCTKGIAVERGIVERHGARGAMRSMYLRDPDGNLIEICSYE